MSFPFRCSIYVRYILLELNNTSSQVSYNKAFIITLKALASVSLSVTTVNRWQWRAVHPIWGWAAHPHSTVDWHTRWHIHTNTHDNIYVHTNTQRHIPKRTHKEVLKHRQHTTLQILSWLPQTPTSRIDRKWLLQLWLSCESKLVTLHSH